MRPEGGGKFTKVLVGVVLLAVIAGGAVVVFDSLISTKNEPSVRRTLPMHFECKKCGHTFEMFRPEFNAQHKDVEDPSGAHAGKAHCPKCGEKFCSILRSICPHCKELVGDAIPGQGKDAGKLVCPHCKKVVGAGTRRPRR